MGHRARVILAVVLACLAWPLRGRAAEKAIPTTLPSSTIPANYSKDSLPPPLWMAVADEPQSVYPQPGVPRDNEGMNAGGVNFDFDFSYLTAYIYRGVDQSTLGQHNEHALQFAGEAKFDLGKFPHPFAGLFANVFNNDPVSRFEEVRPYLGLEWTIKPITLAGGYTAYIFPNRKPLDTQEIFARISLDDSRLFNTEKPVFTPYIFGAYDLDLYDGFYLEAGVRHDFVFEDIGITLTPVVDVAYVAHHPYFAVPGMTHQTGFQHYDAGLIGRYSLNGLLHLPRRYGEWSLTGYLYYTDGIDNHLRSDTLIWGGAGFSFKY